MEKNITAILNKIKALNLIEVLKNGDLASTTNLYLPKQTFDGKLSKLISGDLKRGLRREQQRLLAD